MSFLSKRKTSRSSSVSSTASSTSQTTPPSNPNQTNTLPTKISPQTTALYDYPIPPRTRSLITHLRHSKNINSNAASTAHFITNIQVEEHVETRPSDIRGEHQQLTRTESAGAPPRYNLANRPTRISSLMGKHPPPPISVARTELNADTLASALPSAALDTAKTECTPTINMAEKSGWHTDEDNSPAIVDAMRMIAEKERRREVNRKAALFELIETERSFTKDLRMIVELFLLPIQLLGNRKIVEVIFGDMVKITEMNGMMYSDMVMRLGPLACLVDPERASRNRRKRKPLLKQSGSTSASAHTRSVLQSGSMRSSITPASVSASASTTMSRRLSNPIDRQSLTRHSSVNSHSDAVSVAGGSSLSRSGSQNDGRSSMVSNGDDHSIVTSDVGGESGENSEPRGLSAIGLDSATAGERHDSIRSINGAAEDDEEDATKWTDKQILEYFKNVCIGDVMATYLKDFSEHYAR
ncbi:hypothetical protein LPJ66_005943, partial [Kickxella alabastrina]